MAFTAEMFPVHAEMIKYLLRTASRHTFHVRPAVDVPANTFYLIGEG